MIVCSFVAGQVGFIASWNRDPFLYQQLVLLLFEQMLESSSWNLDAQKQVVATAEQTVVGTVHFGAC